MHGHYAFEQYRNNSVFLWQCLMVLRILDVSALQNALDVPRSQLITDRGHVRRHGAIAERNECSRPCTNFVEQIKIVLVADRAFDETQVHVLWILLHVDDWAVND